MDRSAIIRSKGCPGGVTLQLHVGLPLLQKNGHLFEKGSYIGLFYF